MAKAQTPEGDAVATTITRAHAQREAVHLAGFCAAVAVLVFACNLPRSLWSEETRALTIAWEMWLQHNALIPRVNGVPVIEAPLWPWLVQVGWIGVGANEWWPRALVALLMAGNTLLTAQLATLLWPRTHVARNTVFVLLGIPLWLAAGAVVHGALLFVLCVLLGWIAVLMLGRRRDGRAWLLLAAALTGGLLAGGSAVLVFVLPPALLAPLWVAARPRMNWRHWYVDVAKAVVIAGMVLAAWLIPAALAAGWLYARLWLLPPPVLRPLWLFVLPIVLLPWSLWSPVWRRAFVSRRLPRDGTFTFLALCILPALVMLAWWPLPHLLLPLLPLFAALAAALLTHPTVGQHVAVHGMSVAAPLVIGGIALAVLPVLPGARLPGDVSDLIPYLGGLVLLVGIVAAAVPARPLPIMPLAGASIAFTLIALLLVAWRLDARYRVDEIGVFIGAAQQQGRLVAHVGSYRGAFQFPGRLAHPLTILEPGQVPDWLRTHPGGLVIADGHAWVPSVLTSARPAYERSYRDRAIRIWDRRILDTP